MKSNLKQRIVHSDNLDLDFEIFIQDETANNANRCYILTIHDMGSTHHEFHAFINHPSMMTLRKRIVWIHVELPGQGDDAATLQISKYPSLEDIALELIVILNEIQLSQVVIMGEGLGANIGTRFAILYPQHCLGLVLLRPTATTAGIKETMKDKINNWRLMSKGMNSDAESYLLWNKFGPEGSKVTSMKKDEKRRSRSYSMYPSIMEYEEVALIKEFQEKLYTKRNPKNLALLMDSFLNRHSLLDRMNLIRCDVLVIAGKKSAFLHTTQKFYNKLKDSRSKVDDSNCPLNMENSPLILLEDVGDVMIEAPEKFANSLQFFLQGIGLISGLPLMSSLTGLGRRHRSYSMQLADTPRLSVSDTTKNV